jgi:L-aspartate oxidase
MYSPGENSFLITEAVRGEGGLLKLPDGSRFMPDYDSRAELAPRDIVARAIYTEMKRLQIPAVFLDISHKPADFIRTHFPNIHQECLRRGIDITKAPIPVQPASHYTCGGVVTDASARTDVAGLYCIGEAAYTGLHGANRLASNSLLECVVMASESANSILSATTKHTPTKTIDTFNQDRALTIFEHEAITIATIELREAMWNYVGIVRSNASLAAAKRRIDQLISEVETLYCDCYPEPNLLDLRHLLTMANLIIRCAQDRKESRGCHFNRDWPHSSQIARPTVLEPDARQSDQVPA